MDLIIFTTSVIIINVIYSSEKSCNHPNIASPTIANGTLEINGKRQGGLQVITKLDRNS